MKKIVITGGIGYIGTELCKIYSGYSWNDKITVIDNRFISERVNQLRNWNMNFVHGDILDRELIKKYCQDADIVHHLAGITDVPRVKSETSENKDRLISKVAEECSFKNLKRLEDKKTFDEIEENKNDKEFFRKGLKDDWKNKLSPKLIYEIEKNFKDEMKNLNYI